MKPALLAFGLGPSLVALGEAAILPADLGQILKIGGAVVTLTAFAVTVKHMAEGAKRIGEAADQKAVACFRKLDTLVKDFHNLREAFSEQRGKVDGQLGAWTERVNTVATGVHAARNELGNRITRLEDRLDAMQDKS